MSKHTPAPWSRSWISGALRHIGKNVDSDSFWFPSENENKETANIPSYYTEGDVDIIASAPELLWSLGVLLAMVSNDPKYASETAPFIHRNALEKARQAIAKAEGKH